MRTLSSAGFTLLEMVVAIVVISILMAMAAPLIVHLVDSYTASAEGAELASAMEPAVWQLQWDGRNAKQISVNTTGIPCRLQLTQGTGTLLDGKGISGRNIDYLYSAGEIFQTLPGGTAKLLIAHVTTLNGGCPFVYVNGSGGRLMFYGLQYMGPSGQGKLTAEGVLSADGY